MRSSGIKKYDRGVAISEKHTRHDCCASRSFIHLREVNTPCLCSTFLLLVCLTRTLALIDASWLSAGVSKMSYLPAIEARALRRRGPRNRGSGITLRLLWPIVLRPWNVLLRTWPWYHQLLHWSRVGWPGRCWIH